jgi:hypothetical protein
LDGDQLLMLYVYIAAKSKLDSIFAHLQFCKEFSTPFIKQTRFGYCLTTLEVALTLLNDDQAVVNMSDDD